MWSFLRGKKRSEGVEPSSSTPAEGAQPAPEGQEQPVAEPAARPAETPERAGERPAPEKPSTGGVDVVVQRRLDEVGAGIAPEQDEDDLPHQPRDHQPLSREDVVADALDRWAHQITGGRSAPSFLTQMRAGATVLDLSHSHPSGLAQLLAGRGPTRLSSLVREVGALADARAHARTIREVAERHAEEVGLTTCHLGIGEASWIPAEGAAPVHAPVLIRPITLRLRGNAREDVDLEIDATADLNPVLLRALREAGVAVDARALLATTDSTHGFDPNPVLDAFRSLGEPLPGFRITHALVVGNLMDAAGSVAEDLAAEREDWADSELVAALAGDREARAGLRGTASAAPPALPAEQELVAAVDPDHQAVLAQVLAGKDLAVAAAPGSPTLDLVVDLAEELNARGRSVLVLSQRRRHLAELVEIARGRGVEELVFDLSPDPSLQRNASAALLRSLRRAGSHGLGAQDADPAELGEMREILTGHVEAMHRVQQPWGASAHDAISALAALTRRRPAPRTTVRLRAEVATQMIGEDRLRYAEALQEAAALGVLSTGPEETAWYGAPISSDTQARRAEALIGELRELSLPRLRRAATTTGESLGLQPATSIRRLAERIALLDRVAVVLETFQGAVFSADLPALVAATGDKRWREEHGVTLSWGQRRRLRREAAALQRPAALAPDLHQELAVAAQVREDWRRVAASETATPAVPGTLDTARGAVAQAQKLLDELAVLLDGTPAGADLLGTDVETLQERFDALHRDRDDLATLPRRTELLRRLAFDGLGELVEDLRSRRVPRERVASELDLAWWRSVLELIAGAEPTISQYDGTSLSQVAERFRRLDAASLAAASARVHAAADEARVATMKAYPDTSRAAIGELARSSTVSIRDLAAKYEDILFRARPTWLASPYLVPQVIPRGRHFDVVIVADGGRLPTAAALPAIVRGAQTVVVGDPLEYGGDTAPSLLDDMLRIAPWAELHRDPQPARDGLRAFARRRGLAGETVAVPSPVPAEDDRLIRVENGTGPVSEGTEYVESTEGELRRVTDLVIEHARTRPERSLAVLTVTEEHARRVMERVMNTVSVIPALRGFFDPAAGEFFTVAPAARAAGIVRDDVIVSLGFGKTPHGRLLHRFGPLSEDGGRKALATLITRARGRTLVVSAIDVEDLDPARLRSDGARDLRALLWVLRGGRDVAVLSHVAELTGAAGESPAPAEQPEREQRPTGSQPAVVPEPPAEEAPASPEQEEQDLDAAIEAALARKAAEAQQAEQAEQTEPSEQDREFEPAATGEDLSTEEATTQEATTQEATAEEATVAEAAVTEEAESPDDAPVGADIPAEVPVGAGMADDAATADVAATADDAVAPDDAVTAEDAVAPDAGGDAQTAADAAPAEAAAPSAPSTEDPAAPTTPAHLPRELETDALVRDLADRLWRLGLVVERDFGLTEDRIELALGHPELPGRLLLAVDTDGSRYVATPSQRERDRLRAERLEAAGWATERVWSWALFIDPDGEAARIRRALDRALRLVQAEESGSSPQGVATVRHRLPRPQVPAGHPLSFYSSEDFDAVVEYVCSDGRARLEEHLATEVRAFLGFEQRSVLLDVSVSSAIRRFQERQ